MTTTTDTTGTTLGGGAAGSSAETTETTEDVQAPSTGTSETQTAPDPRTALAVTDDRSRGALALGSTQIMWSPEQRAALFQLGLSQAGDADLAVFLHVSQRTGLDPFSRQIYMIKRWDKDLGAYRWTIQTGIDGFRIIGDRRPEYRGQTAPEWCGTDGVWRDVWLSDKPPVAARVGVYRSDFHHPIYGTALFREYVQRKQNGNVTAMWSGKPSHMLAKCAEALALRKAFPNDLSGLYTDDEMGRLDNPDGADGDGGDGGPVVVDGELAEELTGRPAPVQAESVRADRETQQQEQQQPASAAPAGAGDGFAEYVAAVNAADTGGTTRQGHNDLWTKGTRNPGWLDRPARDDGTTVRSVLITVFRTLRTQNTNSDGGGDGE